MDLFLEYELNLKLENQDGESVLEALKRSSSGSTPQTASHQEWVEKIIALNERAELQRALLEVPMVSKRNPPNASLKWVAGELDSSEINVPAPENIMRQKSRARSL